MGHKLDALIRHHEYFHLSSGRVLKNVNELLNALKSMDDKTFEHHVNKDKNDFGNWIKHVYKDEELASKVFESKSRHEIAKVISTNLFESGKLKEEPKQAYILVEHKPINHAQAQKHAHEDYKPIQKRKPANHPAKANDAPKKADSPSLSPHFGQPELEHHDEEAHLPGITTDPKSKNYIHLDKIEEILVLEREIEKREEKIQEIEERLEKDLQELEKHKNPGFFSREFIHGMLIGLLIALIIGVVYIRFFA